MAGLVTGSRRPTGVPKHLQRDRAYRGLRRAILLQELPGGGRIAEAVWSKRLGVNRCAIREALARLQAEGLIERGPTVGYLVPKLTLQDIFDILETRSLMESEAIDRIGRLGLNTPDRLEGLRAACDDLERVLTAGAIESVPEIDRRFHEAIIAAAENSWLMRLYVRAPIPAIHPATFSRQGWLEWTAPGTLEEHRAILKALLRGESQKARDLLREHLLTRYVGLARQERLLAR